MVWKYCINRVSKIWICIEFSFGTLKYRTLRFLVGSFMRDDRILFMMKFLCLEYCVKMFDMSLMDLSCIKFMFLILNVENVKDVSCSIVVFGSARREIKLVKCVKMMFIFVFNIFVILYFLLFDFFDDEGGGGVETFLFLLVGVFFFLFCSTLFLFLLLL